MVLVWTAFALGSVTLELELVAVVCASSAMDVCLPAFVVMRTWWLACLLGAAERAAGAAGVGLPQ